MLARYNNNAYKIDIPRDKYSVSDIFNINDLSPYHGDENFDPRSDLSQGRGDDAEHPTIIPMDASTPTPRGPMTRARAKAIEDKVNSLLSELPLPTRETWLLPHSETLCVIRCLEASHGTTTYKSQDGEDPKHDGQEELTRKLQALDDRPSPDVRRVPGHGRPDPPDVRYQAT